MGGLRGDAAFSDEFDVAGLDTAVWVPHYLPMWSSRADSAAAYEIADSELRLTIPPEHDLWCAEDHEPALRVSGIQSGVHSGPVGSTVGQQPFRDGAVVREGQETLWGWTPFRGRLEVRARMENGDGPTAAVGMGVHPFRDPALSEEWAAERLALDVTEPHDYAAEWHPASAPDGQVPLLAVDHVRGAPL